MKYFFYLYIVFLISGAFLLFEFSKDQLFFAINTWHSKPADVFFYYITYCGHGVFSLAVIASLLFIKFRYAIIGAISFILTGIAVQLLKIFVFSGNLRPFQYFKDHTDIYFVPGVEVHSLHSFPSGHTATIFCLCLILASVLPKNKAKWGILLFFFALTVGYSRLYLAQHFFEDVYAASVTGTFITYLCLKFMNETKFFKQSWMNHSKGDE